MKRYSSLLGGAILCAMLAVPVASMAEGLPQAPINQREQNQQARINQGVKSGQLTRPEARNLESKEARIRVNQRYDRMKNGKLTAGERARLQKQLNRTSRNIYRDKHNRKVRG